MILFCIQFFVKFEKISGKPKTVQSRRVLNFIIMEKKLTIEGILKDGVEIGLKNFASIIGAVILWLLTIWIPYINVGTTIAISTLPIGLSKGKVMSPTEIFDAKYRKNFGEFFVTIGLQQLAIIPALLFMIVPGIILSLAWSQAIYLVIGHGINPSQAITESNKLTNGHKLTMFLGTFALMFALFISFFIFSQISDALGVLVLILASPIILGARTHIYKKLVLEHYNK